MKKIIHQLTEEQSHNNTFILLLEIWLILKREKNETLEGLTIYIRDIKFNIEKLVKDAIKAKEIKPIDSKSLTETIYTIIETFTLQRTSDNLDGKIKIESLNLLIDGLKV